MLGAILVIYFLPMGVKGFRKGCLFNCLGQVIFTLFFCNMVLITFIGTQAPGYPYGSVSYWLIGYHMFFFTCFNHLSVIWEKSVTPKKE